MKNTQHSSFEFKGLDDWFEVFRAGTQTDSKGRTATFTQDDLDSIVANHTTEQPAPLVVGHPKENHPAYGWTAELKRDGDVLFAKATDVVPEFESAVEAKQYRHRSVSLVPADNGYRLRHIGFLGAVAPAVPGLKDIAFNAEDSGAIEFSVHDAVRSVGWRFGALATVLRRFKNWFIEQQGAEAAENIIPEYTLDELAGAQHIISAELNQDELKTNYKAPQQDVQATLNIHSDSTEETPMSDNKTFSQAELDAAVDAAVSKAIAPLQQENEALKDSQQKADFSARVNEAKQLVSGWIDEGKLLPSQVPGMVEFLSSLEKGDDASFEFSAKQGDASAETKKVTPFDFVTGLIGRLGKQINLNHKSDAGEDLDGGDSTDYVAPNGMAVDPDRASLDKKALEYSKQHNVDYVTAVQLVAQEDS